MKCSVSKRKGQQPVGCKKRHFQNNDVLQLMNWFENVINQSTKTCIFVDSIRHVWVSEFRNSAMLVCIRYLLEIQIISSHASNTHIGAHSMIHSAHTHYMEMKREKTWQIEAFCCVYAFVYVSLARWDIDSMKCSNEIHFEAYKRSMEMWLSPLFEWQARMAAVFVRSWYDFVIKMLPHCVFHACSFVVFTVFDCCACCIAW